MAKEVTRSDKLKNWILSCKDRRVNGLVVTFPGMGVTHIAKEMVASKEVVFLTGRAGELGSLNILYFDWVNNLESFEILDKYFLAAKSDQIIIVVLDDPSLLDSEVFKNSYASKQLYDQYWYGAMTLMETISFIKSFSVKVSGEDGEKIWEISGGIPQLVKHLILRTKVRDIEKLSEDFAVQVMSQPMIKVFSRGSKVYLEKLGFFGGGNLRSKLLSKLVGQEGLGFDIKIRPDLLVLEDGENFKERLSRLEKDILFRMLSNNGFITKDQVAEIKWGSEEYSKFSDQAINKTMRRLDKRLHKYKIVTKWKTGYMLATRNDD